MRFSTFDEIFDFYSYAWWLTSIAPKLKEESGGEGETLKRKEGYKTNFKKVTN